MTGFPLEKDLGVLKALAMLCSYTEHELQCRSHVEWKHVLVKAGNMCWSKLSSRPGVLHSAREFFPVAVRELFQNMNPKIGIEDMI